MHNQGACLPEAPYLGFVAAHAPGTDAVAVAAAYTCDSGHALVVAPYAGKDGATRLRRTAGASFLIADVGDWRGRHATVDEPTTVNTGLGLVDLDTWTANVAAATEATAVLTPSYHIRNRGWDALDALLQATAQSTDPRSV